jgi:hypothetical protein
MTSVEFVYIFGLGGNRNRSFEKLIISKIKIKNIICQNFYYYKNKQSLAVLFFLILLWWANIMFFIFLAFFEQKM